MLSFISKLDINEVDLKYGFCLLNQSYVSTTTCTSSNIQLISKIFLDRIFCHNYLHTSVGVT